MLLPHLISNCIFSFSYFIFYTPFNRYSSSPAEGACLSSPTLDVAQPRVIHVRVYN